MDKWKRNKVFVVMSQVIEGLQQGNVEVDIATNEVKIIPTDNPHKLEELIKHFNLKYIHIWLTKYMFSDEEFSILIEPNKLMPDMLQLSFIVDGVQTDQNPQL